MRMSEADYAAYQNKHKTLSEIAVKNGLPAPVEEIEHNAVIRYLEIKGLCFFHTPNGGKRSKSAGGRLKASGMMKGVPDIIILDAPPLYPNSRGVVIEMKRVAGGVVSQEQKEWLQRFEDRNWQAKVCRGAGEAIDWLRSVGW